MITMKAWSAKQMSSVDGVKAVIVIRKRDKQSSITAANNTIL